MVQTCWLFGFDFTVMYCAVLNLVVLSLKDVGCVWELALDTSDLSASMWMCSLPSVYSQKLDRTRTGNMRYGVQIDVFVFDISPVCVRSHDVDMVKGVTFWPLDQRLQRAAGTRWRS